jgi:hypothetical protein
LLERRLKKLSVYKGETIIGTLPKKNLRLETARPYLKIESCELEVFKIGERSFLENMEFAQIVDLLKVGERSDYFDRFREGATIVPRQFWFVDVISSPRVGINPQKPNLKSSRRAIELAKQEYVGVEVTGTVESEFLYQAATGSEIVPFGYLSLPLVVLPIEKRKDPTMKYGYRIVGREEAKSKRYAGLEEWLTQVETIWKRKRSEKAERQTCYQWLDYNQKLTRQSSRAKFKVLYNSSGTYLVASVIRNSTRPVHANGGTLKSAGLVADYKTHYCDLDDEKEANYLSGFLNSPLIDRLIKPMQSRGSFGERDIGKKVLELPIPKFNLTNPRHNDLADIAADCKTRVRKIIPALSQKYDSIGKIRQLVKEELSEELAQIDRLVKSILLSRSRGRRLDSLLQP